MIAQNRLNGSKYLSYNNRRSNQKLQRFKLVSLMTIAEETASYMYHTRPLWTVCLLGLKIALYLFILKDSHL